MAIRIDALLNRIYEEGVNHDESTDDRAGKMLNITPSTGEFLHWLINEVRPERVLELGTSNGYSTIWIGRAAEMVQAKVVSVEMLPAKVAQAAKNIRAAGLQNEIELRMQTIGAFLRSAEAQQYDFVFLDSDRLSYCDWWPDLCRVLDFGTLVVDNALSHPEQMQSFCDLLADAPDYDYETFAIGKGQIVVRRKGDPLSDAAIEEIRQRCED